MVGGRHCILKSDLLKPRIPWESHVAAARKRSHQWCVSLTPKKTKTIGRMTCHCFVRPIRRDLPSSSYITILVLGTVGLKIRSWQIATYTLQLFKKRATNVWYFVRYKLTTWNNTIKNGTHIFMTSATRSLLSVICFNLRITSAFFVFGSPLRLIVSALKKKQRSEQKSNFKIERFSYGLKKWFR